METIQQTQRVRGVQTQTALSSGAGLLWIFARKPKRALTIIVILAALVLLAFFALRSESPGEKAQKELAAAVAAVGELMILPEGDEPVLATVTDAAALTAQQAFFSGSINGDQLLLFPRSLKAIIYSPSRNKIINAGPIEQTPTTNSATAEQSSAGNKSGTVGVGADPSSSAVAAALDTISVEVRNGSGITGKASQVAKSIAALGGFEAHATDATSNDYTKSVVVAIKNTDSARAGVNTIASALTAAVIKALPAAEESSSADIVLILGSDHTQ